MKSIIKNCLHSSDIYFAQESDGNGMLQSIIKSSTSKVGINCLKNEVNGIEWYNNQGVEKLSILVEKEMSNYYRTKCLYIPGLIHQYDQGFSKNEEYIKLIIDHYCEIWPESPNSNDLYAIHGDLSMCNVIFNNYGKPIIIDWEHFRLHSAPLGFDALNILFEQLWIENEIKQDMYKIIENIAHCIKSLYKNNAIDKIIIDSPLRETVDFIKRNKEIWGLQSNKLPITKFTDDVIEKIDREIIQSL